MSVISGILHFDKRFIVNDEVALMMNSLVIEGAPAPQILIAAEFGCGFQADKNQNSWDKSFESDSTNRIVVADARLNNRHELSEKLGIGFSGENKVGDSELILASFEKWGERCPEHLSGDFAFAIFDRRTRELFCARDPMGARPFFYHCNESKFIFASEPKGILAVPGINQRFNRNKLLAWAIPQAESLYFEQSWFENIFALAAGVSLTVNRAGLRKRQYWEPQLERRLPYKTESETLEAFRELMFEVVGSYFESNSAVTPLLSGGLDSSSIVAVAARILEKQNKQLNVLSAVLPEDSELSDESFFINQFRDFPNVKINYVTAPDKAPFDDLNDLFARYDSPVLTSRHYLYQAFKDAAADSGSHSILDGSGGELGATFHGDGCYAELFSNFRWRTLRRELILRKKLSGESLRYNFRVNVINPLIPDFLVKLKKLDFKNEISPNAVHVLTPEFVADSMANALPELKESRHLKNRVSPNHRINQHRNLLLVQRRAARMVGEFGNRAVEIKFPLMDKRLLEFCLAAPVDLKVRDGYNRYLVRAGLDKILPPAIQWRNSKEPFSPDYLHRYNRQRIQVIEFLADIKKSDPVREIVDVERIKEWILLPVEDAAKNTFAAKIARDYVPQAIYLIHFLRRFAEFRN